MNNLKKCNNHRCTWTLHTIRTSRTATVWTVDVQKWFFEWHWHGPARCNHLACSHTYTIYPNYIDLPIRVITLLEYYFFDVPTRHVKCAHENRCAYTTAPETGTKCNFFFFYEITIKSRGKIIHSHPRLDVNETVCLALGKKKIFDSTSFFRFSKNSIILLSSINYVRTRLRILGFKLYI